ncbi:MAG: lysophospholipid acyltransferase family protein [Pseudomonadota bacterium]
MVMFLRMLARLPLSWIHAAGAALGWLVYWSSPTYAARLKENLYRSGVCADATACAALLKRAVAEAGRGVAELIAVWFGTDDKIVSLAQCDNWEVVEAARRGGQGVIFLTPHIGCFEIAAMYIAQRLPITVLYRPPRLRWVEPLMIAGRSRWQATVAPANLRGVRMFYKTLQRGGAVGLLPDQAPGVGEGAWADFFGRPAYTMTLVGRLQKATGAALIMTFAKRLPHGQGYQIHFEQIQFEALDETALNRAIENVVRRCPEQYLWSYNRYKVPVGAEAPPAPREERRERGEE